MTKHTVYTLHLWHRYDDEISLQTSYEAAQSKLASFCREWWQHEFGDAPIPASEDLLIDTYFALVDDEGGSIESHEIDL